MWERGSIRFAGVACGGWLAPGLTAATENWNGTTWTSSGNINTNRFYGAAAGIQTAGLFFGGGNPGAMASTESYNGSSWTSVNSLNTAKRGTMGAGTQGAAVNFGGENPPTTTLATTELWNGTAWTTNPNSMSTARAQAIGAGTQAAALAIGNNPPSTATEEFTGPSTTLNYKTLTTS